MLVMSSFVRLVSCLNTFVSVSVFCKKCFQSLG